MLYIGWMVILCGHNVKKTSFETRGGGRARSLYATPPSPPPPPGFER